MAKGKRKKGLWPLYCLSFRCFPFAIILFFLLSFSFGHYIVCPFFRTKGQTAYWPKENDKRTENIMAKGKRKKDKQYNGQMSLSFSRFSFGHYIVCPFVVFIWPLYCLYFSRFPVSIILFVLLSFSFSHYIVCPFFLFSFGHYIVCPFVV
jgi:hypothetical protein